MTGVCYSGGELVLGSALRHPECCTLNPWCARERTPHGTGRLNTRVFWRNSHRMHPSLVLNCQPPAPRSDVMKMCLKPVPVERTRACAQRLG